MVSMGILKKDPVKVEPHTIGDGVDMIRLYQHAAGMRAWRELSLSDRVEAMSDLRRLARVATIGFGGVTCALAIANDYPRVPSNDRAPLVPEIFLAGVCMLLCARQWAQLSRALIDAERSRREQEPKS